MKSESISTNLRACVVGAGRMGADHIERLTRRIVGAEVSVVVRRRRFARKEGCRNDSIGCGGLQYRTGLGPRRCRCSCYRDPWFSSQRHVASGSGAGLADFVRETINPRRALLLGNPGGRAAIWKETYPGWLHAPLRCRISASTWPNHVR